METLELERQSSSTWDDSDFMDTEDFYQEKKEETNLKQYNILSKEDLKQMQNQIINDVSDITSLAYDDSEILLYFYRFKKEKLLEEWFKNSDIRKQCGLIHLSSNKRKCKQDMYSCPLCVDDVPINDIYGLSCNHLYCFECWTDWLKARLSLGAECIFSHCIHHKCKQAIPHSFFERFFDSNDLIKFNTLLLDYFVSSIDTIKWCPAPGCIYAIQLHSLRSNIATIECKCGFVFCFGCYSSDHSPVSCDMAKEWTLKNTSESENVTWIMANTKVCPKCKVFIEKNHGCNHMLCAKCHHEFCWICKCAWKSHGTAQGGKYTCNVFDEYSKSEINVQEKAKSDLGRYMFYFNRFDNHFKSLKFAEKTLIEAMDKVNRLEQNTKLNYQDSTFIFDAVKNVIQCRRILAWTYCYGYYLPTNSLQKQLFENQQERLEKFTEQLHELSESSLDKLAETDFRADVINYTRVVETYRNNIIDSFEQTLIKINQ